MGLKLGLLKESNVEADVLVVLFPLMTLLSKITRTSGII
jgi:hypothetical protein